MAGHILLVFTPQNNVVRQKEILAHVRAEYPHMTAEARHICPSAPRDFEGNVGAIIVDGEDKYGIAAAWQKRFPQLRVFDMPAEPEKEKPEPEKPGDATDTPDGETTPPKPEPEHALLPGQIEPKRKR